MFENRIMKIIKDGELAKRISNVNPNSFGVTMKMRVMVGTGIKEFQEMLRG